MIFYSDLGVLARSDCFRRLVPDWWAGMAGHHSFCAREWDRADQHHGLAWTVSVFERGCFLARLLRCYLKGSNFNSNSFPSWYFHWRFLDIWLHAILKTSSQIPQPGSELQNFDDLCWWCLALILNHTTPFSAQWRNSVKINARGELAYIENLAVLSLETETDHWCNPQIYTCPNFQSSEVSVGRLISGPNFQSSWSTWTPPFLSLWISPIGGVTVVWCHISKRDTMHLSFNHCDSPHKLHAKLLDFK